MSVLSRLANVFRSRQVESDLDEELQFHVSERARELMNDGMSYEAAVTEARRRLGNRLSLRDDSRDVKLLPWLDSLLRDVRLGARMLRKNAIVSAAAILSLSLAIGACIAAFSLVDALILRPLPTREPQRLVYLAFPTSEPERPESDTFNDPTFVQLRDAARQQVDLFAMSTQVMRRALFADADEKEALRTQFVSGDVFDRLGIVPAAGRLLTAQDDVRVGDHPVAVVSHAFWIRRFGGDPRAIGRWLTVDNRQYEIVGVTESRFTGVEPGRPTDLWMPYAMYNPRAFGNAQFNWFRILGRLKDGVRVEEAQAVLQASFTSFRRDHAERSDPNRSPESITRFINTPLLVRSAANGPSPLRREFERPLWILAAIATLVLLIAGSNLANLFLSRAAAREPEMALRMSIGAGRARLIQQMLIESALLASAACMLGLLFASLITPAIVSMLAPPEDPVFLDLGLDWRVTLFAALLTLLTTALFGIAPAMRASGTSPLTALKAGGRSLVRGSAMQPFVALQIAFGMVVLFVSGLLVLSFAKVTSINPGFATSDVLLVSLEPIPPVDAQQQRAALLQVLDRLRSVPGVQAASSAEFNSLGRAWTYYVRWPGGATSTIETTIAPVTPGFFETMRVPVISGRGFAPRDLESANEGIVVNETFARRYFNGQTAVGRSIDARFGDANDRSAHEIVGVVADTKYDVRQVAAPIIYIPLRMRGTGTIHVRVAGDPIEFSARVRDEIRAAQPPFKVTAITTQATVVERTLVRERLMALLSGFFALVGLVLAAVGLYSVLSYAVVRRTREIGIRMALGARQPVVVRAVLSEIVGATCVGAIVGLGSALYLSRFVQSLLFEVEPLDFWSLALPLGALLLSTLLAAALPARRAARLDPVVALRHE